MELMVEAEMKKSTRWYLKFFPVFFLAIAIPVLLKGASSAAATDPVVFMKDAVDEIISILQDEKLAVPARKAERKNRVVTIVEKKFDFREMSMRALARHWRDRTPAEQDRFVFLFKTLLENTYIAKIETYSGEKVVFKKTTVQGNKAIVYSDLIRKNIETPVNYKLKSNDNSWMVYDVEVEGVSLVNNYRTQFASILSKENFAGLIAKLEEKVNKGAAE
ncbi:MlaC/ttg2D family ABC transporter substrate-binding protein [Thiovibrio frasassiensis]|jgi:phospholipid transport system substrate-binding protein|uniref:ABC transporter substrate-binding protein n=1 Tax=Thiovibrio frasassiensis TaxID=2984131 RepID=A0A9X4MKB0_9BACT|nr:ABC transporter substrate-binding protein [Thiovibrio frasassiensis]MDG4476389.1 ABC transporter substrate-binding protein [Thiovibrio frasassiensis]